MEISIFQREMSNNWDFGDYAITTTLKEDLLFNEDLILSINAFNDTSYKSYESIINIQDIELSFEKKQKYDILVNCLSKKENYNVNFIVEENTLKIEFSALLEGVFTINFTIVLPEKKQTDENSLILRINQMEIEHKRMIENIETMKNNYEEKLNKSYALIENNNLKISKLERIVEGLSKISYPHQQHPYLDLEILHISDGQYNGRHYGHSIYPSIPVCRINSFINLHTLGLINFKHIMYEDNMRKTTFINYTVKKLSLIYCNNVVFNGIKFFSILEEIEIIDNFEIDIKLKISIEASLDTLVNLKKIVLKNIASNIIELFKKYCKNRGIECEIY